MSGEPELSTASVGRYVASADRPPPWTTLHLCEIGRAPLIKPVSVFRQAEPPLSTRAPVIQVFEDFRFPAAALSQLQEVLNRYTSVFSELRVNTEYGAEVTTLTSR